MMTAIVGAGGKTSLMYALAEKEAAAGKRVIVSTTTHIFQPASDFAYDAQEALKLWKQGRFAVIGTPCGNGKLAAAAAEEMAFWNGQADLFLLEADGAKHLPCKVPAEHEPVIPADCRRVIGVLGMDALGRPLQQVCFRPELAMELLGCGPEHELETEDLVRIALSRRGLAKGTEGKAFSVVLNKCEGEAIAAAELLRAEIVRRDRNCPVVLTAEGKPIPGEEDRYERLLG